MPVPRLSLIAFACAALMAAGCDGPQHGAVIERPAAAPPLELQTLDGGSFRLADQAGDVVLLYFGYTHCPDVCPTVLADWARARRLLGAKAADVKFVFVSVDPARDSPEVAHAYAMQFDSSFVGLSGPEAAIDRIKRDWGFAAFPEGDTRANDYGVAHPASTYVVDRQGRLRVLYHPGVIVEDLASDLRKLL